MSDDVVLRREPFNRFAAVASYRRFVTKRSRRRAPRIGPCRALSYNTFARPPPPPANGRLARHRHRTSRAARDVGRGASPAYDERAAGIATEQSAQSGLVWFGRPERALARVCGYSKCGLGILYYYYIHVYGWVRRSIHTAALHENDRKHGVFIPGAKDKNVDSINRPRSSRRVHRRSRGGRVRGSPGGAPAFDDAPKS